MSVRSLLALATVLCFGIVGCDDPEVEETVTSVLQHGAVKAYAYCYTPQVDPLVLCNTSDNQWIAFKATLFQDGSSFFQYRRSSGFTLTEYNRRGEPVQVNDFNPVGASPIEAAELEDGLLTSTGRCPVGSPQTNIVDVNADMTCTGFNLEAFGIDP